MPEENLLGGLHEGFALIMANFQWERLAMALGAVGAMQIAWERTAAFARERQAFGRPLSGHQAIRHKLVDLATSVYTCRCVTYDALRRFVAGEEPLREVTMAKLLTQRASFELMDGCLQIHGGAGYMREYWVERAARDARLGPIGGGSDEIMREILGRVLGAVAPVRPRAYLPVERAAGSCPHSQASIPERGPSAPRSWLSYPRHVYAPRPLPRPASGSPGSVGARAAHAKTHRKPARRLH